MGIEALSAAVAKVRLLRNETTLGTASGFFWAKQGSPADRPHYYLVTNWHVVTGVNPETGRTLNASGARPNKLILEYWRDDGTHFTSLNSVISPAADRDQVPFLEHPDVGQKIDIACVDLGQPDFRVKAVNDLCKSTLDLVVGGDAFVVGHPTTMDLQGTPLWKRASIASEPEIDVDGLPLILIDSLTSRGMSGSPVVQSRSIGRAKGRGTVILAGAADYNLAGVYSGRAPDPDPQLDTPEPGRIGLQLGRCWKAELIDVIISGNRWAVLD